MTDPGYVLGGYAVTVVAIGGYVGSMWVRNRAVARLKGSGPPGSGPVGAPSDGAPMSGSRDGRG